MEILLYIGGMILVCALALLVIQFMFENFVVSRVMCLVCAAVSMYVAMGAERTELIWPCVIWTALSWLFFRGEASTEVYETGWVFIDVFGNRTIETAGGLIANAIPALIVAWLFYSAASSSFPVVYFLVPGLLIAGGVISFIKGD